MPAVTNQKNPFDTYVSGVRNARQVCLLTGVLTIGGVAVTTILATLGSAYYPWALYGTIVMGVGIVSIALVTYYQRKSMIHHHSTLIQLLNQCGTNWEAGRAFLRLLSPDQQQNFFRFIKNQERRNQTVLLHLQRLDFIEAQNTQQEEETGQTFDFFDLFNKLPAYEDDEEMSTAMLNQLETVENSVDFARQLELVMDSAESCRRIFMRYQTLLQQVDPEAARVLRDMLLSN